MEWKEEYCLGIKGTDNQHKSLAHLQNLKFGKNISIKDLIEFLKDWLVNHILKEDLKIGTYYNNEIIGVDGWGIISN